MTTDVSRRPCRLRGSAKDDRVLVDSTIEVRPEALGVDRWCISESCVSRIGSNEASSLEGTQLTDGDAIASNHEAIPSVWGAHARSTVVAQFSLGDLSCHENNVAHVLPIRKTPDRPMSLVPVLGFTQQRRSATHRERP